MNYTNPPPGRPRNVQNVIRVPRGYRHSAAESGRDKSHVRCEIGNRARVSINKRAMSPDRSDGDRRRGEDETHFRTSGLLFTPS